MFVFGCYNFWSETNELFLVLRQSNFAQSAYYYSNSSDISHHHELIVSLLNVKFCHTVYETNNY